MTLQQIILAICCALVAHCFFIVTTLARLSNRISNRLLALWLLLLAIRAGKSVMGVLYEPVNYPVNIIGLAAMALSGPVMLYYFRSLHQSDFRLKSKDLIHLTPAALLLISVPFLTWKILGAEYYIFTLVLLVYVFLTGYGTWRNRNEYRADDLKWCWTLLLLGGSGVITISFVIQLIFYQPVFYFCNIALATVVVYILSWWALGNSRLFLPDVRKKESADPKLEELALRAQTLLAREDVFTDSLLTLSKIAHQLKAPAYRVSEAINMHFGKTFPELLLHQRIQKVETLLMDTQQNLTVEAIAFECGFNTLSAFYAAFKKIHHQTPTQYKNTKLKSKLKVA
jgi:AraC-like DNA-binding protein